MTAQELDYTPNEIYNDMGVSELENEITKINNPVLQSLIKRWQKTIIHAPMSLSLFYYEPNLRYILNKQNNPKLIEEISKTLQNTKPEYGNMIYKNGDQFKRIFGVPLKDFMDILTGFDVVKFDQYLKTPDGTSTKNYITQKYGETATNLVMSLI